MERIVLFDGEEFRARYFFDIDDQREGLEIYYVPNNSLVGIIDDVSLPDESEQEEVEDFDKAVGMWLERQDINYTLG